MQIPLTLSCSNVGGLICLNDLCPEMKSKFVDLHFAGAGRMAVNSTVGLMIHMYSLFDGSCNLSFSYPYSVVSGVAIEKILQSIKEKLITLN